MQEGATLCDLIFPLQAATLRLYAPTPQEKMQCLHMDRKGLKTPGKAMEIYSSSRAEAISAVKMLVQYSHGHTRILEYF